MNMRLISSLSAIALITTAGVALAQDKGGGKGPTPGPIQMAPGNAGAAEHSMRGPSSDKGRASEQRSLKGTETSPAKEKSSQRAQSDKDRSRGATSEKTENNAAKDNRAAKESKERSSSGAASGEEGRTNTTTEGRNESVAKDHVSISREQRSRVQTAFKSHSGSAKTDVHVEARAGVAIPRSVTLIAIPEDVVVIVPEWRHYKYVLIGDEICIVDPDTYEIVDVIAAV